MTIDPLGKASFSALNIRRCGEMAPKVESGAFRRAEAGCQQSADGSERRRGATWRARVAEGGAEQRSGGGVEPGAGGTSQPAGDRCGRRGCHSRGGRHRWSACRRSGIAHSPGGAGYGSEQRLAGSGDTTPRVAAGRPADAATDITAADGAATIIGGSTNTTGGRLDRCRARGQLLVDRAGVGDPDPRAPARQRRVDELLVGPHRRQLLPVGPSWRSEPAVCRPGDSSSSDLVRDVRSAPSYLAHS